MGLLLAIHLACLHCATQEKLAQYFSRPVSMTCLFACHLRNHAETIALRHFVVNKGKPFHWILGFCDGNMAISYWQVVFQEIQNQVYPRE